LQIASHSAIIATCIANIADDRIIGPENVTTWVNANVKIAENSGTQ